MSIRVIDAEERFVDCLNPKLVKLADLVYSDDCEIHLPFKNVKTFIELLNRYAETENVPLIDCLSPDDLISFFNLVSFLGYPKLKEKLVENINIEIATVIKIKRENFFIEEFQSQLYDTNDFYLFVEHILRMNDDVALEKIKKERGFLSNDIILEIIKSDDPEIFKRNIPPDITVDDAYQYLIIALMEKSYRIYLSVMFELTYVMNKHGVDTTIMYNEFLPSLVELNKLFNTEFRTQTSHNLIEYIFSNREIFCGLAWILSVEKEKVVLSKLLKMNPNGFDVVRDVIEQIDVRKYLSDTISLDVIISNILES